MSEVWKPLEMYPGYEVSNHGNVRSYKRSDIPRPVAVNPGGSRGYPQVCLMCNGKMITRRVHRLVLEAFVGPRPDGTECRHKDGCKTNRRLENLEWATRAVNVADKQVHGGQPRGNKSPATKICDGNAIVVHMLSALTGADRVELIDIGKAFRIHPATVGGILRGRRFGLPASSKLTSARWYAPRKLTSKNAKPSREVA